jgi:autophagy-related protein 5
MDSEVATTIFTASLTRVLASLNGSYTPPTMSTYGGRHAPVHAPSAFAPAHSTPAATTLFRRLTWEGTIPVEIRVDPKELPANSDRGLECYYIQAPRVSYLPLLVPELKRFLMDVVFDDVGGKALKEEDWWFEAEDGGLLKW